MFAIIFFNLFFGFTQDQTPTNPPVTKAEIEAINQYVGFVNESIHGLLIVHRLLENNNQDINKYVDLAGYQINFYSNSDLPKNIFVDPEQWFYEKSPQARFTELKKFESNLPANIRQQIIGQASKLNQICNKVNNIRFEVEEYINEHDLTVRKNLYGVYELLEKSVSLYSEFYTIQKEFEKAVRPIISNQKKALASDEFFAIYSSFEKLHKTTESLLLALRQRESSKSIGSILNKLESAQNDFKGKIANDSPIKFQGITEKVDEIINATGEFLAGGAVPKEYKLYGKFYYFHNSNIINKFNRYGNGFVNEMNIISQNQSASYPQFLEIPHFFQVIYPMKIIEQDYLISSTDFIEEIPMTYDDRRVTKNQETIQVDNYLLELELYDHKLKDNDIVSINFNGDWIHKNLSLETEPKKLKLKLNESGKNYLLIHTESVGIISPNTTAIKYKIGPKRDEIILQSDMETSALIEFSLDD